jgi:NAD(P)-dependent dehydrogenase (short-subunit alcohol dehydrogenase family)
MSDIQSVKQAAEQLLSMEIDYLILNAGAYSIPRCVCDTGYDNVFEINFISPYYLARRLLPSIKGRGGKIVAVGSIAHNYSRIDETDPDFKTRKKASLVYGNAKRYLTYSLFNLGREGGISVAHPGITFTGITDHYPPLIYAIIKYPMKLIFMHPRKACLSVLRAMSDDVGVGEWVGPEVFDVWGMPKIKPLKTATRDEQIKICEIAEEIYNKINIK